MLGLVYISQGPGAKGEGRAKRRNQKVQRRRIAKSVAAAVAVDCNRQLQPAVWKRRTTFALARAVAIGHAQTGEFEPEFTIEFAIDCDLVQRINTSFSARLLAILKSEEDFAREDSAAVEKEFKKARAAAPSIVFFDEIDALAVQRQ